MSSVFPNRKLVGTILCSRCSKPFPSTVYLHPLDDFGAPCPFDFLDYKNPYSWVFNCSILK